MRPKGFAPCAKYLLVQAARKLGSFWLGVEIWFMVFYFYKSRRLEANAAKPPQIPKGVALQMLHRMFQATEDIQAGGKLIERPSAGRTPILTQNTNITRQNSCDLKDAQAGFKLKPTESNVEDLLRLWDSALPDSPPADAFQVPVVRSSAGKSMESMLDDAEMFALKQAEVSGWFVQKSKGNAERWPAVRICEIRRGNMEEFLAWAFYHCSTKDVPPERREELEQMLNEGSRWVGIEFKPGYNEDAHAMRITMDRIISEHRPFLFYALTALVVPAVTNYMLGRLGFMQYTSGTLSYWHRPADASGSSSLPPIVFIHGLGINILPYYNFIAELLRVACGRTLFLLSLPHISMRLQEHVPSCAEMVACLSDMLASWGHSSAHFVGHSFGTLPLAWMVRLAPSRVSMATFIDPVCFLIIKPDVCYNFIYRRPSTPMQMISQFFVARELYIANSLSRNFFWFTNLLWPEDLAMPALVVLSGRDGIVPAHSIRRYMSVYKQRHGLSTLKVHWMPENDHGEACISGGRSIIADMLLMDSLYPSQVGSPLAAKASQRNS